MTRLQPWCKVHILENWPQRNQNKLTLELKINCTSNSQDDTAQTTNDQFQDDCQSQPCCFCVQHISSVYESTSPVNVSVQGGGGGGRPLDRSPPSPHCGLPASTNLASLLAFERQATGPPYFWLQLLIMRMDEILTLRDDL